MHYGAAEDAAEPSLGVLFASIAAGVAAGSLLIVGTKCAEEANGEVDEETVAASHLPLPQIMALLDTYYESKSEADKEKALKLATLAVGPEPQIASVELLVLAARAAKNYSDFKVGNEKVPLLSQALTFAEIVRDREPQRWEGHYWYGISLSLLGDFKPTKEAIQNAYVIKEAFDKALQYNPRPNGTNYHILGMWAFTFADMAWYTRKIASLVFAAPPTATYDEALAYFLDAEKVEPGFYVKNNLMIGKCYIALGKYDEAKAWLSQGLTVDIKTPKDADLLVELKALLAKAELKIEQQAAVIQRLT